MHTDMQSHVPVFLMKKTAPQKTTVFIRYNSDNPAYAKKNHCIFV